MTGKIKIAVAQMAGRLKDIQANMSEAILLSREAARKGARLVLFPEGCLTGNATELARQDSLKADCQEFSHLQECSDELDLAICIGFHTPADEGLNSAFAVVRPGRELLVQYKCCKSPAEPAFLVRHEDKERKVFEVDGIRFAICICCEYASEEIHAEIANARADVLLHPSAGNIGLDQISSEVNSKTTEMFHAGNEEIIERASEDVRRRGYVKASSNPIGFDGEAWWPGNSYVIGRDGKIILWMKGENSPDKIRSGVKVVEIEIEKGATA